MRPHRPVVALLVCLALSPLLHALEPGHKFTNLQVLPKDVSVEALDEAMLANLRGLGLRRLAGVGCLHCHVGDMETPRSEWDYASDAKPAKHKARVMMAMVQAINETHLTRLKSRLDSSFQITCFSCHRGRVDPRPLGDVLWSEYEAQGIGSAITRYRELHSRYLGSPAYDFRVPVLAAVATRMSSRGAFDDAIELSQVNAETHADDPSARRSWVQFRLERTAHAQGVDRALAELGTLESELAAGVVNYQVLDHLGWRLFRQGHRADAEVVHRRNLAKFPGEYVPLESVAWLLNDAGEKAAAARLLEQWLEQHPDHDRARRLLINFSKE